MQAASRYDNDVAGGDKGPEALHWGQDLLQEALRMVFQNILLESRPAILAKSMVWCLPLSAD